MLSQLALHRALTGFVEGMTGAWNGNDGMAMGPPHGLERDKASLGRAFGAGTANEVHE